MTFAPNQITGIFLSVFWYIIIWNRRLMWSLLQTRGQLFPAKVTRKINFKTGLQIDKRYRPFPKPSTTHQLVECSTSRSGKVMCNHAGLESCHLQRNSHRKKAHFTNCSTSFVCLEANGGVYAAYIKAHITRTESSADLAHLIE